MKLLFHSMTIVVLIGACSGQTDSGTQSGAGPAPSAGGSVPAIVGALRSAGLKVAAAGTLQQPFFTAAANVFTVEGNDLQLYEFGTAAEAERAAAQVAPDGGSIGTASIAWMAPPHFFRNDRVVAIYIGTSARVHAELQRLLGPQFAGRD